MLRIHSLNSPEELCSHLVNRWIHVVRERTEGPVMSFALAGGSTPWPIYRAFAGQLSASDLPQGASLRFVATDERWVPDSDPQSNEGMIRECFAALAEKGIPYQLVSLKTGDASVNSKAVATVSERVAAELPRPLTSLILGMGTDSHIASIFPSAGNVPLNAGLDCLAAVHPQTGQERMSLAMQRLMRARRIWLVITGDEKLRILQEANESHDPRSPISVLLHNAPCPVDVFWHPA